MMHAQTRPTPLPRLARLLFTLALSAGALVPAGTTAAATWPAITLPQLCRISSDVVRARIVSSQAAVDAKGHIFTAQELVVLDRAHPPSDTGTTLTVYQIGGRVGDLTHAVAGMPVWKVGDEFVLFLGEAPDGRKMPLAGPRGALRVVDGEIPELPGIWPEAATHDPAVFLAHVERVISSQPQAQ